MLQLQREDLTKIINNIKQTEHIEIDEDAQEFVINISNNTIKILITYMEKLKITLNVIIVTCVIGLAISYLTQLIPMLPKLTFLEAVGVYCLWTPLHHFLNTIGKDNIE